ncbi:MAG: hypothetical protein AAF328_04515 [Planctomycetota bacterium]
MICCFRLFLGCVAFVAVWLFALPSIAVPLTLEIPTKGESSGGPAPDDDFEYTLSLDFAVVTNLDGSDPSEQIFNTTRFEFATVPIVVSDEPQTLVASFDSDQLNALQSFVPTGDSFEGPGITLIGNNANSSISSPSSPTDAFSRQDLLDARITDVRFEIGSFQIVPTDASLFPPGVDVSGLFSYVLRDTKITLLPEPTATTGLAVLALATLRRERE